MPNNNYGLYFHENGVTIRIPVNPQEYPIKYPADNMRYNVLGKGEIIVARIPKLKQISWESYFPCGPDDPLVLTGGAFEPPEFYITAINRYKEKGEPVRFIANRFMEDGSPIFDTNMNVIVEDFDVTEKGGETGDFYYSISLSEYREYIPQKVTVRPAENIKIADAPAVVVENDVVNPPGLNPPSSNNLPDAKTHRKQIPAIATATEQREVPKHIINVGDTVTANGEVRYTPNGEAPHGSANNTQTTVTRILQKQEEGQDYPVYADKLGWVQMSQLKKG